MNRRLRLLVVLAVAAAALATPFMLEPFQVEQVTAAIVLSALILALGLLTGFTGQISLGHSAFFGLGAYTTAILVEDHGWPHLATIPVAGALCFCVGLAVGLPALRIRGLYLALVTLALAAVFPTLIRRFDGLTHGNNGINFDDMRAPAWSGLADDQWIYLLVLTMTAGLFLLARNIVRSQVGRAMIAVRDEETGAAVMGVHVARIKTLTFGVSALFAGIAGTLNAILVGAVAPDSYTVLHSISYLAGLVIGGVGSLIGPVLGGFVLHYLPRYAGDVDENLADVVYGGALILLMYIAPDGLAGLPRRAAALITRARRDPDEQSRPTGLLKSPPAVRSGAR